MQTNAYKFIMFVLFVFLFVVVVVLFCFLNLPIYNSLFFFSFFFWVGRPNWMAFRIRPNRTKNVWFWQRFAAKNNRIHTTVFFFLLIRSKIKHFSLLLQWTPLVDSDANLQRCSSLRQLLPLPQLPLTQSLTLDPLQRRGASKVRAESSALTLPAFGCTGKSIRLIVLLIPFTSCLSLGSRVDGSLWSACGRPSLRRPQGTARYVQSFSGCFF